MNHKIPNKQKALIEKWEIEDSPEIGFWHWSFGKVI